MSKELKIKGALSKDYQQLYVDDEPTGIEINNDGKVRIKDLGVKNSSALSNENLRIIKGEDYFTSNSSVNPNKSAIRIDGDLVLDADGSMWFDGATDGGFFFTNGNAYIHTFKIDTDNREISFHDATTNADLFKIAVAAEGATTISTVDYGGAAGHMTLVPDGDLTLDPVSQKVIINATDGLYFDGGGDTYIYEASADVLRVVVVNNITMEIIADSSDGDGNQVRFVNASAGFTQLEPTYDATTVVDFRFSNKQFVTFGAGNITNMRSIFPAMSGNFVLLLKQDGTGSRTVANWVALESDESTADGSATVVWAGGSAPTLTTDANFVDILSFYWDADNEIAYGVATLNFDPT